MSQYRQGLLDIQEQKNLYAAFETMLKCLDEVGIRLNKLEHKVKELERYASDKRADS